MCQFLFILFIVFRGCECVEPFYLKYFNLENNDKLLFNKYYQSFRRFENDPKEYVIKTNCSSGVDFEGWFGKSVFISGVNETAMIIYANESEIKNCFSEYKDCTLEYEEMSVIMKLIFIKNKNSTNNEYIMKFRENHLKSEDQLIHLLNEVEDYLDEVNSIISPYKTKMKETKVLDEVIDNERIIKLMKNTKSIRKKIKDKSHKQSLKRRLKSNSFRILKPKSSSLKHILVYIEPESVNEILSYLLTRNEIDSVYINHRKRIIPIIQEEYSCNNHTSSCRQLKSDDFSHIKYLQSLSTGEEIAWKHQLSGKNILLGIGDSGLDIYHCMFYDKNNNIVYDNINMNHRKVVEYFIYVDSTDTNNGHGTHVCGIASGYSITDDSSKSLAYDSKILFWDLGEGGVNIYTPIDIGEEYLKLLMDDGCIVSSMSWGTDEYKYTIESYNLDRFLYANPTHVALIAANNYGYYPYPTITSEAQFKNGISVGSNNRPDFNEDETDDSRYYISYFSSLGPTNDNRIKPDIVVMGRSIYSSQAIENDNYEHCSYFQLSGTSMATPLGASAVAIIEQYLQEGYYPTGTKVSGNGFTPTSSLVKAMLIHSGENAKGYYSRQESKNLFDKWPNNRQGFGIASLDRILYFADNPHFRLLLLEEEGISSNEIHSYKYYFNVTQQFKVTLVWNDPPVDYRATSYLLNHLHLKVKVNNTIIHPNSLSQEDNTNNVQVITIPPCYYSNDTISNFAAEIIISADSISTSSQNYSLVITGIFYDNENDPIKEYNLLPLPIISVDPFTGKKVDLVCQNPQYIVNPTSKKSDSENGGITESTTMKPVYIVLISAACVAVLFLILACCYCICRCRMKEIHHHRISPEEINVPTP